MENQIILASAINNGNTEPVWILPRSVDSYKALFIQASRACREKGMGGQDSLLIAATVLASIGIDIPSAMEK